MEFFIIVTAVIIAALFSNNVNEKNATKKKQQTLIPPIFEQKKGICCFCGEKTGVFETYHKGCLNVYLDGKAKLSELSANLLSDEMDITVFDDTIKDIKDNNYVQEQEIKPCLIDLFNKSVDAALSNDIITEITEKNLLTYINHFELSPSNDVSNAWEKACKGVTLRKLTQGILPQQIRIIDNIPFVLQKNEKVIWCFKEVTQLKYKNKTVYQGSSAGYSFKVAKGFYIRQSFFKGHPVHYTSLEHEDSGCIVLTDKNLYFCGQYNIFRLPYDRILAINPYYATVVIQKDTTTAKPIIFEIDDVWFFYNLIYNLIHMEF